MKKSQSTDRSGSRREFLAGAAAASATFVLPARGVAAGGFFAGGDERIRVGLIGCGGRGTGAALQAAAADPAVRIVALGDLFSDQVGSAAALLGRDVPTQFDCPAGRRFSGENAYRDVLDAGVDVVLLAAPPHVRPLHLAAAVRAGKHVFCEKPAAIDLPGVHDVAEACATARRQGLSVVSGLCSRRDEATVGMIGRIHDGMIGRPLAIHAHALIGLPWQKPMQPGWSVEEWRQRNWISFRRFSGGHFVEHHVQAIDRALWALGDACPVAAEAFAAGLPAAERRPAGWSIGDCDGRVSVRYSFADGSVVHASCERAAVHQTRVSEIVAGTAGSCDLRRQAAGTAAARGRYQATLDALLLGVRSGAAVDDGPIVCRSTLAAIMGRLAATMPVPVRWEDVVRPDLPVNPAPTMKSGMIVA